MKLSSLAFGVTLLLGGCTKAPPPPAPAEKPPTPKIGALQMRSHASAFGAILAKLNEENIYDLAPWHPPETAQTILADSWNTNSRAELLALLDGIVAGTKGHRAAYREQRERFRSVPLENLAAVLITDVKDPRELDRRVVVLANLARPAGKTLPVSAWDFGRYINLCRWGCQAGYLTEDEAWEKILPAARLLQASFKSWDEYAADYLLGRVYWSGTAMRKDGEQMREVVADFLHPKTGIWAQIDWNQSLGDGPMLKDGFAEIISAGNPTKISPPPANPAQAPDRTTQ